MAEGRRSTGGGSDHLPWNLPPPLGFESGDSAAVGPSPKKTPKPRNVFTVSTFLAQASGSLGEPSKEDLNAQTQELLEQLQAESAEKVDSSDDSESSASTAKRMAHHGSMENLFKPKNHRSSGQFQGARRKSTNSRSEDKEMVEKLTEENFLLISDAKKCRKKEKQFKTIASLSLAAFRVQRLEKLAALKKTDEKVKEAALRMIMHNLLLNSWRINKAQLHSAIDENAQLTSTVENLNLQLRVVRHIQALEKEKLHEKAGEVERVRSEMRRMQEEDESRKATVEKIEAEFNTLQGKVQNLEDLNKLYAEDAVLLKQTIRALEQSLESERQKASTFERANNVLNHDKQRLTEHITEITRQSQNWQESARAFESEAWAMRMDLESESNKLKECQNACDTLKKEKAEALRSKSGLKEEIAEMKDKLESVKIDKEDLSQKVDYQRGINEELERRIKQLENDLQVAKKDFLAVEKELLNFKSVNVKRRRYWADTLYFIFSPLDAFRRSLMPLPNPHEYVRRSM